MHTPFYVKTIRLLKYNYKKYTRANSLIQFRNQSKQATFINKRMHSFNLG